MIEVRDLVKSFNGIPVVKHFSARFERGKATYIIGESGSGKTTIIKCMVGLLLPDGGQVLYDGNDIITAPEEIKRSIRQNIGFVFQGGALFDSFTVEENVMFPLRIFSRMSYEEMKERVEECLRKVNLNGVGHKYPSELSGGMRKRVAIARGIINNPRYLFFDEPTSGLDPNTARIIDSEIKKLTEELNTTTVIISHDVVSVFEVADHVIFIWKGEKLWEGPPREMLSTDIPQIKEFLRNSIAR